MTLQGVGYTNQHRKTQLTCAQRGELGRDLNTRRPIVHTLHGSSRLGIDYLATRWVNA